MGIRHALAGTIGERERQVITAVVDEIMVGGGEDFALKELLPIKNEPAAILLHEKVSGWGGFTQERTLDEKGKSVGGRSSKSKYFDPASYQEFVLFTERDLLRLRRLGTLGERGITGFTAGMLDELSVAGMKLKQRVENRMALNAWTAMFDGTFTSLGGTFSFEIPATNALVSGTSWETAETATPFTDLWNIQNNTAATRKYLIKEFVINRKTMTAMMVSDQAKYVLRNYNLQANDINAVGQFLFPGLAKIHVVIDAYQDETVVDGIVTLGDATFFVPDYKVLLLMDFSKAMYKQYGDSCIAENMNGPGATAEKPATGIYLFVDEKGLEERQNPHIKVVAGFNGGPNLRRSDDVFTVDVSAAGVRA